MRGQKRVAGTLDTDQYRSASKRVQGEFRSVSDSTPGDSVPVNGPIGDQRPLSLQELRLLKARMFVACLVLAGCQSPGGIPFSATSEPTQQTRGIEPRIAERVNEPGQSALKTVSPVQFVESSSYARQSVDGQRDPPSGDGSYGEGPSGLDLDDLIAKALAIHPSIQAALHRVAAARCRIPQAKALDDPTFDNTIWPIQDQALQTAGGRVAHQFALSQQVPWPAKRDARAAVALREMRVAEAEVEKLRREITAEVKLAYYQLWLAAELIEILEDNQEIVKDLIQVSEARYQAGGSQQDVLRVSWKVTSWKTN